MKIDGPVLAATALGQPSDEALRQAHRIAAPLGAALVLVHVLPPMVGRRPLFPELRHFDREHAQELEDLARATMRQQWRRVVGTEPAESDLVLETGTPHSGLLRRAEELGAGLIVVGSGSHGAGTSEGGVAERVVRHAHCPVLVAHAATGGPVIVGTDFSDPALPAIHWGAAEARSRGVKFSVLHSIDLFVAPVYSPEGHLLQAAVSLVDARRDEARERLARIEAEFRPSDGVLLREGPADVALIKAAEQFGADLLVVGTHGRTGFRRIAMGSVAEGVVRNARCSVLVVRLAA